MNESSCNKIKVNSCMHEKMQQRNHYLNLNLAFHTAYAMHLNQPNNKTFNTLAYNTTKFLVLPLNEPPCTKIKVSAFKQHSKNPHFNHITHEKQFLLKKKERKKERSKLC